MAPQSCSSSWAAWDSASTVSLRPGSEQRAQRPPPIGSATMPSRRHILLLSIAAIIVLPACLIAGIAWYAGCDWVPASTMDRLPNATRAEVRAVLGEPTAVDRSDDFERWTYRPAFRFAEFQVWFNRQGRVKD